MTRQQCNDPLKMYEQMVAIAKAVRNGQMSVIDASRRLVKLRRQAGMAGDDIFHPFLAIDFETHHLPVGNDRERWPADSLEKKDREIREVEAHYRHDAMVACDRLIQKLEPRLHQ